MHRFTDIFLFIFSILTVFPIGCGTGGNGKEATDSTGNGDADGDTDADTDVDTDADADSDSDSDSDSDTDADTDNDADADTDSDADADTDSDTDADTDSDADADTDSDADADTDSDADVDGDADTDADGDADPPCAEDCMGPQECIQTGGTEVAGACDMGWQVCCNTGSVDGDADTDTEADTDTDPDVDADCIQIDRTSLKEYAPSSVRVTFRVLDCAGYPVRKLDQPGDVTIINDETGNDFNDSSEGGGASAPDVPSEFGFFSILALDMSDSIFNNNAVDDVISGAKVFVQKMVTEPTPALKHKVAVMVFGRTDAIRIVQNFTDNDTLLINTLDGLLTTTSLGTTNLYGAYTQAIQAVESQGTGLDLVERSVVILTDGTHEAGDEAILKSQALTAKTTGDLNYNLTTFSIGIQGDWDEAKLAELASKPNYFVMAEDAAALETVFENVSQLVESIAHSNYVVGICTPVELGNPSLTIQVSVDGLTGSTTRSYATTLLTGDITSCAPTLIAAPCTNRVCGAGILTGFQCGTCAGTTDWCNEGICEDDCAEMACGVSPNTHVNCGICPGTTDWCNAGTCEDDCAQLECGISPNGSLNCGTCTGTTEWCNEGTCENDCVDIQCGTSPNAGLNCGTCTGESEWCNAGICDDDCLGLNCGTSPLKGYNCGTCSNDAPICIENICTESPLQMVSVSGGEFDMGGDTGDADELPVHTVTIADFEMSLSEVTVAQYEACFAIGECTAPGTSTGCNWNVAGKEDHPVNCVDWNQAVAYCAWTGGRLPTESEWEYAARNEGQAIAYPWGDETATCDYAIMIDEALVGGCGESGTGPVCSKPAGNSVQGFCDLSGNVWEWNQDWYHTTYTGAPTDGSAWVSPSETRRVTRGGAWTGTSQNLRSANRGGAAPTTTDKSYGFRCARTIV